MPREDDATYRSRAQQAHDRAVQAARRIAALRERRQRLRDGAPLTTEDLVRAADAAADAKQRAQTARERAQVRAADLTERTPSRPAAREQSRTEEVEDLERAIAHRTVIGIAVGKLMHAYDLDEDAAFAVLKRLSSTQNRKLFLVAEEIAANPDATAWVSGATVRPGLSS